MIEEDFDPMADLAKAEKKEKKAAAATPSTDDDKKTDALKEKGEEVSQDDIDALFG